MRISSKGRYGLAALTSIAQNYESDACTTIVSISEKLGISKIYLEQVFSLLKRAELVVAIKGAQGGYKLSRSPQTINVFDVLRSLEQSLFEKTEESVAREANGIEQAMQKTVFSAVDTAIASTLEKISLYDLVTEAEKQKKTDEFMFYI